MEFPSFLEPGPVKTVIAIRKIIYWTFILIFTALLLDGQYDSIVVGPETILGLIFLATSSIIFVETLFERHILEFPSRLDTLPVGVGLISGTVSLFVGIGFTFDITVLINVFEPFMTYVYLKAILVLGYVWYRGTIETDISSSL